MLWYWLLFFFITVGAKFVLALLMIYLLLPSDRHCGECEEGETLLLEGSRVVRIVTRAFPGRLERRWCPRCGREGFARPVLRRTVPEPIPETRTTSRP